MSNNKPVILVTGSNGQLGNELQQLAPSFTEYAFLFATRENLNIADEAAIENYFAAHSINFCINCAAYTAVDKAESEPEHAFLTLYRFAGWFLQNKSLGVRKRNANPVRK